MRQLYCLLGDPVGHSRSPAIHARAFALLSVDAVYAPCPVSAAALPEAFAGLRALGAAGFNLTVPHKGAAVGLCDAVSPEAGRAGAVNCVLREGARLVGHNTDGPGLLRALRAAGVSFAGAQVVVLGAGGSARAAALALAPHAAQIMVVNRSEARARSLASLLRAAGATSASAALDSEPARAALARATLVINCTTVGMGTSELPFDPALLAGPELAPAPADPSRAGPGLSGPGRACAVVDLVYAGAPDMAPGETALLRVARSQGCKTVGGVEVLVHQAILSLELWLRRPQLDHLAVELRAAALGADLRDQGAPATESA